jgi:hypothetical protein
MDENTNTPQKIVPTHIFQSLQLVQNDLRNPTKDTKGHNYKYAQLDQILEILKPVLTKHDLGIMQSPSGAVVEGCLTLKTVIFHKSGEHLIEEFQIPIPQGRNVTQDYGSALSYARRYSILSLFSLAQEDDDGQGTKPKSEKIVKITPEHNKAIEDVNAKIERLEVRDFANGTKFIPENVTLARLKKFMDTSDDICVSMAEKWRAK